MTGGLSSHLAAETGGGTAGAGPHDLHALARAWPLEPGVIVPLGLLAALYVRGLATNRTTRAPLGRGEVAAFAGGWLALAIALASPLHPLGQVLFSAHMTQHELLMLVAAPLLVLGRPHVAVLRALPVAALRSGVARGVARTVAPAVAVLARPPVAWAVHAATLWAWHAPPLFDAALRNETVHALQHLTFLGSSLLFWWAVLEHGTHRASGYGAAVLYLFTTALHSGLLGALLTFASGVWYPAYGNAARAWGWTPLADQQLGGVIMWAPACALYTVSALALFLAWLRDAGERTRRAEDLTRHLGAHP